jgi:peptidoglycan hydrolase-like protein with peptidoglycan-binding domain/lysophospholipase L1-like esterase
VQASDVVPNAVVVYGRGNGHGRGMSQWGSYGWATTQGWSWQQILSFYYPGLPQGPLANPNQEMSIHLSAMDNAQTAVVADASNGLFLQDPAPGRAWTSLVAREITERVYRVWGSMERKCPSANDPAAEGFTLIADVPTVASFATTTSRDPASPANLAVGLCEPRLNGRNKIRYYRGEVRAVNNARGQNRTINVLPIESYLRGVVPRESPAEWGSAADGAGMNALRAQAVAARSYAATENRYAGLARTCDTQSCQVYGGAMVREALNTTPIALEHPLTDQAIADTAEVAVLQNGNPVRTEFSATNGGRTAGGVFPVQADPGDAVTEQINSLYVWTRIISARAIQSKWPQVGSLVSVRTSHDGQGGDFGGYTTGVTISGTSGSITVSGWTFKSTFDLPAPWFGVNPIGGAPFDAAPVGSILFLGDSVGESITDEYASVIVPAYPRNNFQAKSNRCLVGPNCIQAAGVLPDGISIINSLAPDQYPNVVVVQLGYNDNPSTFAGNVDQVVNALNTRGVQRVVFVNLSTRRTTSNYALSNQVLAEATAKYPNVTVLDWNAASSAPSQYRWFRDGVHLTSTGRAEFTMWIRGQLDSLRSQGLITIGSGGVMPLGAPMSLGNRGDNVKRLQNALNAYLQPPKKRRLRVDGVMNKATVAAVIEAETRAGLAADGVADEQLLATIGIDPATIVVKRGTRHPTVATAQTALGRVLKVKVRADGNYGPATQNLVRRFQKMAGVRANGNLNATTWRLLLNAASTR